MGLLKKKKKSSGGLSKRLAAGGGGSGAQISALRPRYADQQPPCIGHCPSGNDIRGWLMTLSLREKLGLTLDEAYEQAWRLEMETNPFPATMGRICPHPCEGECNRGHKDGAVGINSVERALGDWALDAGLKPERRADAETRGQSVAVIGSGPAGLSCAYQLARRGYGVTVYESLPEPGGMLRYGIPDYRLPREILAAEIDNITSLGVELLCNAKVGDAISFDELREKHDAIFLAIGAHQGKHLGIPGEDGPGIWTGTDFLNHANSGKKVEVGAKVVIIGGGDTAIDAARVSKRLAIDAAAVSKRHGADVTIVYRRTRTEMPAIEREIEEALEEDIAIEFLAAPAEILRHEDGSVRAMVVQRMELGEPDDSGRRRPVPVEGDTFEMEVDTVIAAVSQKPDLGALGSDALGDGWLEADADGRTSVDGVWTGGDNLNLGIATTAIGQGRRAAESIDAALRGVELRPPSSLPTIGKDKLRLDWYEALDRRDRRVIAPDERLAHTHDEIDLGLAADDVLLEAKRCLSCGQCFACENCWMYCQNTCFARKDEVEIGSFFTIKMDRCDGCKKCWEECPCGVLVGE